MGWTGCTIVIDGSGVPLPSTDRVYCCHQRVAGAIVIPDLIRDRRSKWDDPLTTPVPGLPSRVRPVGLRGAGGMAGSVVAESGGATELEADPGSSPG
jgi:hypothetical protein